MNEFKAIMLMLFTVYREPVNNLLITSYYDFLKSYSLQDIKWAAKKYVEDGNKFFPKPGELIVMLKVAYDEIAKTEAEDEWAEIYENIKRGRYNSENEISEQAIRRIGGWSSMRSMLEEHEPFRRKDFIENYISIATRNEVKESHRLSQLNNTEKLNHEEMQKLSSNVSGS
jgi:hypothetical protein